MRVVLQNARMKSVLFVCFFLYEHRNNTLTRGTVRSDRSKAGASNVLPLLSERRISARTRVFVLECETSHAEPASSPGPLAALQVRSDVVVENERARYKASLDGGPPEPNLYTPTARVFSVPSRSSRWPVPPRGSPAAAVSTPGPCTLQHSIRCNTL